MEADGYWVVDEDHGSENGSCCLSATLRDYGRIGLFALRKGVLPDGTATLPEGFLDAAIQPWSESAPGYGYLWWIDTNSFAARGIFGQIISIYPDDDLVIVSHAFSDHPTAAFDYAARLFDAIRKELAGPAPPVHP